MSVKHLCRYLRRSPPSPAAMASNPGTVRKTFPGGLYFGGDFASNYRTGSSRELGRRCSQRAVFFALHT
jgi:hypothetical protein